MYEQVLAKLRLEKQKPMFEDLSLIAELTSPDGDWSAVPEYTIDDMNAIAVSAIDILIGSLLEAELSIPEWISGIPKPTPSEVLTTKIDWAWNQWYPYRHAPSAKQVTYWVVYHSFLTIREVLEYSQFI